MKTCIKCGNDFPVFVRINGKRRNLNNRKYCLTCSPFGLHNTTKIHNPKRQNGTCKICGRKTLNRRDGRPRYMCSSCQNKQEEDKKCDKLYGIIGEACWICGYDKNRKGRPVLDFHHLFDKNIGLTKGNIGKFKWDDIWKEAQKCISICCRCHREIHAGLIEKDFVEKIHKNRWKEIMGD